MSGRARDSHSDTFDADGPWAKPPAMYGSVPGVRTVPAVLCPLCGGQKHVNKPPYVAGDQVSWVANTTGSYTCPVCKGAGIIGGGAA